MGKLIAALAALMVLVTPTGVATPVDRVEVYGDLARARHVAVVVPGSDVDGARFDATVGRMARAVRARAGRDDLAVVAWLGYRTPSGVGVDAASGRLARAGAVALARFVRGLPGEVHLLCHSYGSVVCALADVRVADMAFLGSPGVRVASAGELRARVWAARGADDWTRWVPSVRLGDLGHGVDPTDPAFGAGVFDTGEARRHDQYFDPGTASLGALARIAVGERP
ncbi:alpha/beta hydrolase [Saccharothrix australiensis]|uniref:Alpha/beta hydrolase family protein n=1 Tax=Saccharothrix australiensis TaxID=2072 RepID=A0A495W7Y7_9PSEU|nr:alpha/beta hydrolase [Saccharothrix australiensis]RKT57394.1 alpha/beta hydrolase family protein [Saccharothrix australiensis]